MRGPWLAAAMAGALVSAAGLTLAGVRLLGLRRSLDRLAAGDLSATGVDDSERQLPLSVLLAAALVCQGGAHAGLLLAGVHSQSGVVAAPALHVLLGFGVGACHLRRHAAACAADTCRGRSDTCGAGLVGFAGDTTAPVRGASAAHPDVRGARHSRAPPAAA